MLDSCNFLLIIIILLLFTIVTLNRAIYLRRSLPARFVFQIILLIGWHVGLFFILPSDPLTGRYVPMHEASCMQHLIQLGPVHFILCYPRTSHTVSKLSPQEIFYWFHHLLHWFCLQVFMPCICVNGEVIRLFSIIAGFIQDFCRGEVNIMIAKLRGGVL